MRSRRRPYWQNAGPQAYYQSRPRESTVGHRFGGFRRRLVEGGPCGVFYYNVRGSQHDRVALPPPVPGEVAQPIAYPPAREFTEPDWTRIPAYRGVSRRDWESALWQRQHTIKNVRELKAALGDLLACQSLADSIVRDHATRATMSMLIPPHMINTMRGRGSVARSRAPLHGPRGRRPRAGMAQPSLRHARQPARGRHVGGRGIDPSLSHQGPRGAALDLPAVLRPLHANGPRWERRAAGREDPLRRATGRAVRADPRLPAADPECARRGGVRRRHREPAHHSPRAVRQRADRHPAHSRHPPGEQGNGRTSRSTSCRRASCRDSSGWHARRSRAGSTWPCTRTSTTPAGDAPRRARSRERCSRSAFAMSATRVCSSVGSTRPRKICSSCASCSSITPRSCRTTSTCAT